MIVCIRVYLCLYKIEIYSLTWFEYEKQENSYFILHSLNLYRFCLPVIIQFQIWKLFLHDHKKTLFDFLLSYKTRKGYSWAWIYLTKTESIFIVFVLCGVVNIKNVYHFSFFTSHTCNAIISHTPNHTAIHTHPPIKYSCFSFITKSYANNNQPIIYYSWYANPPNLSSSIIA